MNPVEKGLGGLGLEVCAFGVMRCCGTGRCCGLVLGMWEVWGLGGDGMDWDVEGWELL